MKKKNNKIMIVIYSILLIIGIGYFVYSLLFINNDQLYNIINSFLIIFLTIMLFMNHLTKKNVYKVFSVFMIMSIISCSILNSFDVFAKKIDILGNLVNKPINDVLKWADEKNITIEQIYEYSDNIDEFYIISQDIDSNTPIDEIENIKLIISSGPNYDKIVIIPNLVGLNVEKLIETKNELLLNNVEINYVKSDESKDTIISQSLKGQYARNTKISFTISLGNETISEINMIDLIGKDIFEASIWLKQNNINYEITYEFNEKNKNEIISQSIKADTVVNTSNDKLNLIISKGESITVPNLLTMSSDEVVKWISDNDLKIEFNETYHTTIPLGGVISANYSEGDIIESGTLIKITTSKGQIKFPSVSTLQELKNWANGYNIIVNEEYSTNSSVPKGNIISANYKIDDIVDSTKPISVVISTGAPITVPNFYNMSKSAISTKCSSLGLVCTFYEKSYSSIALNNAISQNVSAGATVTSGKTISIGLSKGPAKTYTVKINQASISSCIGDSSCSINYLKSYFSSNYPGVTFTYVTESSSTFNNAGFIHENSPIKDGSSVTQGNTYKVIITK